jgi:hypothetical protein
MDFDISLAITTIKGVIDLYRAMQGEATDPETKEKILDTLDKVVIVQGSLYQAQNELMRLQEEKRQLSEKVRSLEDKLALQEAMTFDGRMYWKMQDEKKDGPFCQLCWDSEKLLIRLQGNENDQWYCCKCRGSYHGPNYRTRPLSQSHRRGGWMS